MLTLKLLTILLLANGSPVVVRALLGERLQTPLDGGLRLADGHRLLGPAKTLIGALTAIAVSTVLAPILGFSWQLGLLIGGLTMLGDAASSFVKRRRGIAPGEMAPGLDHIPESLLPILACSPLLGLGWAELLLIPVAFTVANLTISRLLYRLGIRHHPH